MKNSPYLDRPLLPLGVALPRMPEEIEAALTTAGPAETQRLHQRAELVRGLLGVTLPSPGTVPRRGPAPWSNAT